MRILHLLKHGQRGNGNVHVAVDLACAQADAGHEVVFAAARSSYTAVMESHGVQVVNLTEPGGARDVPRNARELWRLCRRTRPDIVNAHMMSSAVIAFPVTKALRIALITTMHNSFDPHSRLMRLGRVVVAVSDSERRLLLSRGYKPHKVVTVINGAVASPREERAGQPPVIARPCVMAMSGLHPRKAVDSVIRSFALLATEFPEWHLNIVGGGPDEATLQRLVVDLGLQDVVHLLGFSDAPKAMLEQAAIFATATLADPCPLTVMEARATGCAIVATSVGGIPEVLGDGSAGLLVPINDPEKMADRLRFLMTDSRELDNWRRRSAAGADFFRVDRMARDHIAVYESIIRGGPVHRPGGVPR